MHLLTCSLAALCQHNVAHNILLTQKYSKIGEQVNLLSESNPNTQYTAAACVGLDIFVDDEFKADGRTSSPGGLPSSAGAGPSAPAWAHLGSFEQTRKENVQQASVWAGESLHTSPDYTAFPQLAWRHAAISGICVACSSVESVIKPRPKLRIYLCRILCCAGWMSC